jgi:hypothetical protein
MGGRAIGLLITLLLSSGCKERYRVGEYVLVEWCDGEYPAYVIADKGRTRYQVHFEGYESRWDTEVQFDAIKRKLDAPLPNPPPLCGKVARALGIKEKDDEPASAYEVGARVRVTWRGSVYKASIVEILGPERFKVHYDGHASSWDEVVTSDRIVSGTGASP